jgi:hypothetical protein
MKILMKKRRYFNSELQVICWSTMVEGNER